LAAVLRVCYTPAG